MVGEDENDGERKKQLFTPKYRKKAKSYDG